MIDNDERHRRQFRITPVQRAQQAKQHVLAQRKRVKIYRRWLHCIFGLRENREKQTIEKMLVEAIRCRGSLRTVCSLEL